MRTGSAATFTTKQFQSFGKVWRQGAEVKYLLCRMIGDTKDCIPGFEVAAEDDQSEHSHVELTC